MEKKNEGTKTVEEIKKFEAEQEKVRALFAATKDAVTLQNLTKSENRTYTSFSQELIRNYLKSPFRNQDNLRNLSQFLYRMSQQYRRLIQFYAEMIDLGAYYLTPPREMVENEDIEGAKQLFFDTAEVVKKLGLKEQLYKLILKAWREDAAYGYCYYSEDEGLYIMPLDAQYCKISSVNLDGSMNFSYDFSFFRSHSDYLEYWDSEFQKKYNSYQTNPDLRWQELDPERTVCFKINTEDLILELPPFVALFEPLVRLLDVAELQNVRDELSAYMLLVARLEHLQGSTTPDEYSTDIDTAIAYFNRLSEALPDYVNAVLSPVPIDAIQFKDTNGTDQEDMLARSMDNLFATSGGYQILGSKESNSSILNAQIIADSIAGLKPLLAQIEKWTNRYLTYIMGDHFTVNYIEVTPYNKKDVKEQLLKSAQYGSPVKLALASLDGLSPLDALGSEFLENKCLELHKNWIPLQSSFTSSGAVDGTDEVEGGRPEKDVTDLTDEGESTRSGDKNNA